MKSEQFIPHWMQDWLSMITIVGNIVLIMLVAWFLQRASRRLITRLDNRYTFPVELSVGARRISGFIVYGSAFLVILGRLGVSGQFLWTTITGFTAVAAVAFFAAWSVLSNIFCAILIFITRPFRLMDNIELVDGGDKPGLKGRVIDINLIHTTLAEDGDRRTLLKIPNNLFFQRTVRSESGHADRRREI